MDALSGTVGRYPLGEQLIAEFRSFLYDKAHIYTEEKLMAAFEAFSTKYPDVPPSTYRCVYDLKMRTCIMTGPYICKRT